MKKLVLALFLTLLVGLSSASNIPYDGMTLNYERHTVEEHSELPSLNNENREEMTLFLSKTSEGYRIESSGIPDLQDYTVEEDTPTDFWLVKHGVSTGEELEIFDKTYTITSTSTEIETDAFGSVKVIEAVYESFSPEKTLGGKSGIPETQVSEYSEEWTNYYHPKSGLLLKNKREITATQEIQSQADNVIEVVQTDEITKNGVDNDEDGLTDLVELIKYNTDPVKEDTDEDGLNDGAEVQEHDTNPRKVDTDGDNLTDEEEINLETDPNEADTDSDGLSDGREQELGTSPTEADSDGDGLDDAREVEIGSDPNEADSDQDGLNDGREVERGTSPTETDTDGDFLNDQIDPMPTNPILPNGVIALVMVAVGGLVYRRKNEEE